MKGICMYRVRFFQERCSETAFKVTLLELKPSPCPPAAHAKSADWPWIVFFQEPSQSWSPLGTRQRHTLLWDGTAWEAEHVWVCSAANEEESGPGVPYRFFPVFFSPRIGKTPELPFTQDTLVFQ